MKKILWTILKRIGQLVLTVFIVRFFAFLFNFFGFKLDDKFVFSGCLDCVPWFRFTFDYIFVFLCLICFIWAIISVRRKKISKFWIFDGLVGFITALFCIYLPIWATYNSIKYPNALPVVLRVSPSDQTYVFYEGKIPEDKKGTLTGFVIQKDNPVPVRYENGKIKEYTAGNKWYSSDDIEYSEDKIHATHKTTHEPITGFVVRMGETSGTIVEYQNGKIGENRFLVFIEEDTGWLAGRTYVKDGHIRRFQEFYPNGFLKINNFKTDDTQFQGYMYYPNGQLLLKTVNQNINADSSWAGVESLQRSYYNTKGELVSYWDMRYNKFLCVNSDGKGRQMTFPAEIQRFFDGADNFLYMSGGKIPEFWCDYQAKTSILNLLKSLAGVVK